MQSFEVIGYTSTGQIEALIEGLIWFVPDEESNRHRQMIAEWEQKGNTIPPFISPPTPLVTSVSARQFKLQLLAAGLLDQVETWIASQSKAVQIAYEYSGTFVRSEPMMASGFAAMGFTDVQIDAFFEGASQL
jgi:hypothetical protein